MEKIAEARNAHEDRCLARHAVQIEKAEVADRTAGIRIRVFSLDHQVIFGEKSGNPAVAGLISLSFNRNVTFR
jgi:hypothetical protein